MSSMHRCYNPLSYQRGSVWPHDTMLAAAGMWRYGYRDEASSLIRAVLDAAGTFESDRLPELYCGFGRELGPPVPYATPSRVFSSRRENCAPAVHDVSSVGSNRNEARAAQLSRLLTSVGRPAGTSTSGK